MKCKECGTEIGRFEPMLDTTTREYLLEIIGDSFLEVVREKHPKENFIVLRIDCLCGKRYNFNNFFEIPKKNLKCECGRYLIKYERKKRD